MDDLFRQLAEWLVKEMKTTPLCGRSLTKDEGELVARHYPSENLDTWKHVTHVVQSPEGSAVAALEWNQHFLRNLNVGFRFRDEAPLPVEPLPRQPFFFNADFRNARYDSTTGFVSCYYLVAESLAIRKEDMAQSILSIMAGINWQ